MRNEIFYFENEDEREIVKPPYYNIVYIDDIGKKHLVTIAKENKEYIAFILDRFIIREVKIIEE